MHTQKIIVSLHFLYYINIHNSLSFRERNRYILSIYKLTSTATTTFMSYNETFKCSTQRINETIAEKFHTYTCEVQMTISRP